MDKRYKERGYSASLTEADYGSFLTIQREGKIIGEVAVGFFEGGKDEAPRIIVKRFTANEPLRVTLDNVFDMNEE